MKALLHTSVLLLILTGCSNEEEVSPTTTRDSGHADAVGDARPLDDAATAADMEESHVPDDAPSFVCRSPDQTVPETLYSEEEFRIYPQLDADITRRSDLVEEGFVDSDGNLTITGTYLSAPPEMNGGRGSLRSMFIEAGQDVRMFGGWWTERPVRESSRASLTLLVNYEPVEATYIFRGPENEETLATFEDTGALAPMTEDFMSFEIVIDGSNFEEPGIYDLGLRADAYDDFGSIATRSHRISVFAGGYEIPEHPCFERTDYSAPTEIEREIYPVGGRAAGMLYPVDLESRDELIDDSLTVQKFRAAPGEEVDLTLALRSKDDEPYKSVWIPLVNGRPQGSARFVHLPAIRQTFGPAFRDQIRVSLPETEGLTDVVVAQWFDPFEPRADRFGEHVGVGRTPLVGTNYLHYVVE